MLLSELPPYRAGIPAPCDVVDRRTGKADRVMVEVDVGIPIDAGRTLPYGACFGDVWPVSRLFYGRGHGYDSIGELDYLRSGDDFFAPDHVLGVHHLNQPGVARRSSGLALVSVRAFVDWAELVGDPDFDLGWRRPHAETGRAFPFDPLKQTPVPMDDGFRARYSFDEAFADRLRRVARENFVIRPGGVWMRMPLPVWRIFEGTIGLDPFPRGPRSQTTSFALDRLEDVEAQLRATSGRRVDGAIAARSARIHHLDADVADGARDDLDVLCRTDLRDAAAAAARVLPMLDPASIDVWHALVNAPPPAGLRDRREAASAFVRLAEGIAAAEPSDERSVWLDRHDTLRYRLQVLELPRTAAYALPEMPGPA
jgi:hypothetical protein